MRILRAKYRGGLPMARATRPLDAAAHYRLK